MEELAKNVGLTEKLKKDWLKITLLSSIGLIILSGVFYAGYWYARRQQVTPTPTPAVSPIPIPEKPSPLSKIEEKGSVRRTQKILYRSGKNIYLANPDGSNPKQVAVLPKGDVGLHASKDGKIILYLDLAGGLGEDYSVRDAFILNTLTNEKKSLPEFLPGTTRHHLSPQGNMVLYEENRTLWLLDLEKGIKEKLKELSSYATEIAIEFWSADGKKVYFYYPFISRSGFKPSWFVNDTVYSIDVFTKKETIEGDYSQICDTLFSFGYLGNDFFLAWCGKNHSQDYTAKLYNRKDGVITDILTGNLYDIACCQASPDLKRFIYYDNTQTSLMSLDLKNRSRTKLGIVQNQTAHFSPDGKYFIYHSFREGDRPLGLNLYNLENNQVTTILSDPGVYFIGWVEESQD